MAHQTPDRRLYRGHGRATPNCPHCETKLVSLAELSIHLRFTCPVIRPAERRADAIVEWAMNGGAA